MIQIMIVITGILIALAFDWRMRKIPNALTFSMIALGFILNTYEQGLTGLQHSSLGLVLGILLLYLPFQGGGVGGGDVKLLGAIGSIVGPVFIFKIFLVSAIFGGALSLVMIIKNKAVKK